jgi:hypothetical protein
MQRGPSHALFIIVSHRVILPLSCIHKKIPSGLGPKYSRYLYGILLLVSFPPIFDTGNNLKERKGDIFSVRKIVDKEITF